MDDVGANNNTNEDVYDKNHFKKNNEFINKKLGFDD